VIDYDELESIAEREKPKVIIGGGERVFAYLGVWPHAADCRQGRAPS
jgi:glycine/serine hydroxymethyltransferase